MADFAHAIVYVLFVWWFSTGAILYLDGLNPRTFRWTILSATVIMAVSIAVLISTRSDPSLWGAYAAFTAAVLIWGWNEVLFLMGFVTGPWRQACPKGARGWQRLRFASLSLLHHEILIAASGLGIVALTWGAANQVGLWTFGVLWAMRLSTKLNIYLGVPNLSEEFLPNHLAYLASFFARRSMNLLFPVSVTVSTMMLVGLVWVAGSPSASAVDRTSLTLVATLLGLGLVEHWFLVLPIRVSSLWSWGLASHQPDPAKGSAIPLVLSPAAARREIGTPPQAQANPIATVATP